MYLCGCMSEYARNLCAQERSWCLCLRARAWKPFTSTARRDNAKFSHWVLSNAEFLDYPFARFNKKVCM